MSPGSTLLCSTLMFCSISVFLYDARILSVLIYFQCYIVVYLLQLVMGVLCIYYKKHF